MNILFLCTSNKDRSPALEKHFREKYPMHKYRSAISREITQNYGSFYEMEPERVDMFYTFLGIANMALKGIPEHLETSNPTELHGHKSPKGMGDKQ